MNQPTRPKIPPVFTPVIKVVPGTMLQRKTRLFQPPLQPQAVLISALKGLTGKANVPAAFQPFPNRPPQVFAPPVKPTFKVPHTRPAMQKSAVNVGVRAIQRSEEPKKQASLFNYLAKPIPTPDPRALALANQASGPTNKMAASLIIMYGVNMAKEYTAEYGNDTEERKDMNDDWYDYHLHVEQTLMDKADEYFKSQEGSQRKDGGLLKLKMHIRSSPCVFCIEKLEKFAKKTAYKNIKLVISFDEYWVNSDSVKSKSRFENVTKAKARYEQAQTNSDNHLTIKM